MSECKLIVDLDCLLDTRLGTVMRMDDSLALPLLENGYLNRLHNNLGLLYPKINQVEWEQLYRKRDLATLKLSLRTHLVGLLGGYTREAAVGDPNHPQHLDFQITVNLYPYALPTEDLDALTEVLLLEFGVAELKYISKSPTEINVKFLKNQYDRYVTFELTEWLYLHREELKVNKMPLFTLEGPMSYIKGMETKNKLNINVRTAVDVSPEMVIHYSKAIWSQHINLEFTMLSDMSVFIPTAMKEKYHDPTSDEDTEDLD